MNLEDLKELEHKYRSNVYKGRKRQGVRNLCLYSSNGDVEIYKGGTLFRDCYYVLYKGEFISNLILSDSNTRIVAQENPQEFKHQIEIHLGDEY